MNVDLYDELISLIDFELNKAKISYDLAKEEYMRYRNSDCFEALANAYREMRIAHERVFAIKDMLELVVNTCFSHVRTRVNERNYISDFCTFLGDQCGIQKDNIDKEYCYLIEKARELL